MYTGWCTLSFALDQNSGRLTILPIGVYVNTTSEHAFTAFVTRLRTALSTRSLCSRLKGGHTCTIRKGGTWGITTGLIQSGFEVVSWPAYAPIGSLASARVVTTGSFDVYF